MLLFDPELVLSMLVPRTVPACSQPLGLDMLVLTQIEHRLVPIPSLLCLHRAVADLLIDVTILFSNSSTNVTSISSLSSDAGGISWLLPTLEPFVVGSCNCCLGCQLHSF